MHPTPHRPLLRRHRLAWLTPDGWRVVLRQAWDAQAHECLGHWASHGLPLVVTRQPADAAADGSVALGLPAPLRWDRRRLALRVPRVGVGGFGEFPWLADLANPADMTSVDGVAGRPDHRQPASTSTSMRELARDVVAALDARGATARVFGSHGWQAITGLDHVRPASDLDLWIGVDDVAHADAVARALRCFEDARPRLDGELVFADGAAVAWREWADWRAGRARAVLVRHLDGVSLRRDTAWCAASASASILPSLPRPSQHPYSPLSLPPREVHP